MKTPFTYTAYALCIFIALIFISVSTIDAAPSLRAANDCTSVTKISASQLIEDRFKITAMLEIYKGDELSVFVGIIDKTSGYSFLLSKGKVREGLELLSTDYEKQQVLLKHNNDVYAVDMGAPSPRLVDSILAPPYLRRPGVYGIPSRRAESAATLRRARYENPPISNKGRGK